MWTKDFWKGLAERAIATGAQSAIAIFAVDGFDLLTVDWLGVVSVIGVAVLLSVLKSIAANRITGNGPSLTNAEVTVDSQAPVVDAPLRPADYAGEDAV
jgi:hypothetical protein